MSPMDIAPKALTASLRARPFHTSFTRQMNTARSLYGKQLIIPVFTKNGITDSLQPMLEYYPQRDRGIMNDRIVECILTRQRLMS